MTKFFSEINKMDYPDFISVFSTVIEHGTHAAACVWGARPYSDIPSITVAFTEFLHSMNPNCQKGLIRCYPDLAGKLAVEEGLTKESTLEHRAAGLIELTDNERCELSTLNTSYKDKFGFPFVICARENKKKTIMRELCRRMENNAEEELETAMKEISKIASYRIKSLVESYAEGR